MSTVKSYSFNDGDIRGDMYYIYHNSSNFTVIDCNLQCEEGRANEILEEIAIKAKEKKICRFILTHPDRDHYAGIEKLLDVLNTTNIYAVYNDALSNETDESSIKCREIIHASETWHIKADLSRKFLNDSDEEVKSSGIFFRWPIISNPKFVEALQKASEGKSPNNISPVILYSIDRGATFMWMGDMETDMQEEFYRVCEKKIIPVDILFAPHHGRKTGRVPDKLLEKLNPKIIVVGNAPSQDLAYDNYDSEKTITQNTAGDIVFEAEGNNVHVYTANNVQNLPKCLQKMQGYTSPAGMVYLGTLTVAQQ